MLTCHKQATVSKSSASKGESLGLSSKHPTVLCLCSWLQNAKIGAADWSGKNLQDALLSNTDLRGADLRGADLTNSDLTDANLDSCTMKNVKLTGARFDVKV